MPSFPLCELYFILVWISWVPANWEYLTQKNKKEKTKSTYAVWHQNVLYTTTYNKTLTIYTELNWKRADQLGLRLDVPLFEINTNALAERILTWKSHLTAFVGLTVRVIN